MKRKFLAFLAGLAAIFAMMLTAAPAQAASSHYQYNGNDWGRVAWGYSPCGTCRQDHRWVVAQDNECDGHRFYVRYKYHDYTVDVNAARVVDDEDGCGGQAYQASFVGGDHHVVNVYAFQACEELDGLDACKDWVETPATINV